MGYCQEEAMRHGLGMVGLDCQHAGIIPMYCTVHHLSAVYVYVWLCTFVHDSAVWLTLLKLSENNILSWARGQFNSNNVCMHRYVCVHIMKKWYYRIHASKNPCIHVSKNSLYMCACV